MGSMVEDIKTAIFSEYTDIGIEVIESQIDNYLDEGFIKNIPIIGGMYKTYSLAKSVNNAFLLKKLCVFLYNTKKIPLEDRINFLNKYVNAKEIEFTEKLLICIDKYDDIQKCLYMCSLFKSMVYESIETKTFLRLCKILETIYLDDLKFLFENIDEELIGGISAIALTNVGLALQCRIDPNVSIEDGDLYCISSLGRTLENNIRKYAV